MKYEVYQAHLTDSQRIRVNAGDPDIQPLYQAYLAAHIDQDVVPALKYMLYRHVATIEADDLEDVFEVGNIGPEHQIERIAPMHSVSVGDIIRDPQGRTFVVASFGFDQLGG